MDELDFACLGMCLTVLEKMTTINSLRWTSILGYGLGDMANNFAFSMGMLFLLNYYTDVAGISAAAAGTMLVAVRIYDAMMDVVAGRVIDRNRASSRWGRFRPYLLWGALPLLLLNVAVFSVPAGWSDEGKLVYAYITYALLGTAYSFVNIAYGSLASAMTQVPRERSLLSAARTLMATVAIVSLAFMVGSMLRNASVDAVQTQLTRFTWLMVIIGMILYAACFKTTREVVERDIVQPELKASLSTLRSNFPLLVLCLVAVCVMVGVSSSGASAMYYARYVLGDLKYFVAIIVSTTICGVLVSVPISSILVGRLGKKGVFKLGMAVAVLAHLLLFFAPSTNLLWVFGSLILGSIGSMLAMIVLWALEGDTVEYGEWQTGVRIEGMNYAFFSLTRKCGQALGGSIPAFLLAASAYVPNLAIQDSTAIRAIQGSVALVPAAAFALAFLIMCFYPLSDRRFLELVQEIKMRRK